jgi:hypothetical protein
MPRVLSAIKRSLVPAGKRPRSVLFGPLRGLRMNLDLRHQTQVWFGLSEREVFPHLRAFAREATVGIDVGAAEGEYTLFYLAQPRMKHVLAFDPSDRFPEELNANLALNGFAGDRRLTLEKRFVSDSEDGSHCTLDACAAAALGGPCVVKIDVDGGESSVLRGARRLLARKDVFWIIETHSADLESECVRMLREAGHETQIVPNAWWRVFVPEHRPIPHNRWLTARKVG